MGSIPSRPRTNFLERKLGKFRNGGRKDRGHLKQGGGGIPVAWKRGAFKGLASRVSIVYRIGSNIGNENKAEKLLVRQENEQSPRMHTKAFDTRFFCRLTFLISLDRSIAFPFEFKYRYSSNTFVSKIEYMNIDVNLHFIHPSTNDAIRKRKNVTIALSINYSSDDIIIFQNQNCAVCYLDLYFKQIITEFTSNSNHNIMLSARWKIIRAMDRINEFYYINSNVKEVFLLEKNKYIYISKQIVNLT